MRNIIYLMLAFSLFSCQKEEVIAPDYSENILNYQASPKDAFDRSYLAFSDQGAWFAYGLSEQAISGFSGPFLMTEQNGVWCSPSISQFELKLDQKPLNLSNFTYSSKSTAAYLQQIYENDELRIEQILFFNTPHQSMIQTTITNLSEESKKLEISFFGTHFAEGMKFRDNQNGIQMTSENSNAMGQIQFSNKELDIEHITDSSYNTNSYCFSLEKEQKEEILYSHQFVFPEHTTELNSEIPFTKFNTNLEKRKAEKQKDLDLIYSKMSSDFQQQEYKELAAKTYLTLQNNWRIAAGELKHEGLFPSYHYKWFHGFWAWDSWKHAVALAIYNPELAKNQIRAMYDYMDSTGFIVDCIYRDTTIENHNYRNTKPPLSAWAVWKVYQQDADLDFIKEMYPLIKTQHQWWYKNRDHDMDGLCEYGSTDGTLIAAKWESGMDNAVRFDNSEILQNSPIAWSLNQESVDLNAYLFAEKNYLAQMAQKLGFFEEEKQFKSELKQIAIQSQQFYNTDKNWCFDSYLDGQSQIEIMGCEGWIPLWANMMDNDKLALGIKDNIMNKDYFNTKVPLQTLSASHPKFKPEGGYWRGPVWLDQSYLGVMGLKNYGFEKEALELTKKLIHNADGVLGKGKSIRENYQPITGNGLESESFSWSAAHYLLLMMEEE